jgi:2-polyprenyl-6-hydroxyphenyl methylase/3-demethylubiquinone-9 3-methyltransferase
MTIKTTVDDLEVAKFAQHADEWWNKEGPLRTLHDINPARIDFIYKFTEVNDKQILDVGCGGGILSEALASEGAEVTGLDVEKEAIFTAKNHALARHIKINYVCQPIEKFKAQLFDVVTCMEMLEHVADPALVIKHCARLLKPGGYLFLSTINRTMKAYASVIIAGEYLLGLLPRQTHDFDKFIKVSELAAMTRDVGLEMVGVEGMSYHPFTRKASLQESVSVNYLMACQKI